MKGVLALAFVASQTASVMAQPADPRLREITYDPQAVVTLPVKRGVVTLIALDADEAITEVAAGLGGDCSKPEAAWCIAAQPGGHHLFIKPKSTADAANTLAVVTDRRTHSFQLVVLADGDRKPPVYRLVVKAPAVPAARSSSAAGASGTASFPGFAMPTLPPLQAKPTQQDLIAERLQTQPKMQNAAYSLAEGAGAQDIVPTLVFDDGRFTYLRFPGNREVPAVFHVLGDGTETLVNARMEDDLLVVDRVSRRLMLRAGSAVVSVWNDAFDLDGLPPKDGTTVPGIQRRLQTQHKTTNAGKAIHTIKPDTPIATAAEADHE